MGSTTRRIYSLIGYEIGNIHIIRSRRPIKSWRKTSKEYCCQFPLLVKFKPFQLAHATVLNSTQPSFIYGIALNDAHQLLHQSASHSVITNLPQQDSLRFPNQLPTFPCRTKFL